MTAKRINIWALFFAIALGVWNSAALADSHHVIVTVNSCYTLATRSSTAENPCPADVIFLEGTNVDISSAIPNSINLCLLKGTFKTVDKVPSDYSKCNWDSYVEGGEGLAGKGMILRDRSGQHHFKWLIQSNMLPKIVFDQVTID